MNATSNDRQLGPFAQPIAPPYALAAPSFRFRALASLAGRAPLGGTREVVLATYLIARLTDDSRASKALPAPVRAARAAAARSWLANTALPASVRSSLTRLAEATEGEVPHLTSALTDVIAVAAPFLDDPARLELERLARTVSS